MWLCAGDDLAAHIARARNVVTRPTCADQRKLCAAGLPGGRRGRGQAHGGSSGRRGWRGPAGTPGRRLAVARVRVRGGCRPVADPAGLDRRCRRRDDLPAVPDGLQRHRRPHPAERARAARGVRRRPAVRPAAHRAGRRGAARPAPVQPAGAGRSRAAGRRGGPAARRRGRRAGRRGAGSEHRRGSRDPGKAPAVFATTTAAAFPGSRERSTTIITYLFFRPGTPIGTQTAGAEAYAHRYAAGHLVGVTGPAPAQEAQGSLILRYLPWVELATVAAIALIVGLHFRAPGAPLATLVCVGVAYLVAVRVVALVARHTGATVPPDAEPVLAVLLLGVTTDYSVFYLAGMRARLAEGLTRGQAARRTTAEYTPIIVTAGL